MGGRASKGTPADRRLKANKTTSSKTQPMPGAPMPVKQMPKTMRGRR